MLKRFAPQDVQLGMFIDSFEGSWLAHPFWRKRFLVTDPDDLRRVRASKVRAVVINLAMGAGPTIIAAAPAMPICVASDRVPAAVTGDALKARRRETDIAEDMRRMFSRHIAADMGASSSAQAEYADVVRVLANAGRALTRKFEGVARGEPLAIDGLDGIIDNISAAMVTSRATMIGLSRLKLKDEYTFQHSIAVGALMLGLARDLGLDDDITRQLALGGLLHDVGKMKIPDAILNKPGPMTSAEFDEMKRHARIGYDVLRQDPSLSPIVLEVTLRHHERLDGGGYPDGLAGDAVSLYARIAAICDVFDALTSARVYKEAMPAQDAITLMASWKGQFDRDILIAFMRTIGAYPTGMLVRLSSLRLAVILPPGRRAARPRARVFHCAMLDRPLPPCDVVISEAGQGEQVLSEESPDDWAIGDWAAVSARLLGRSHRRAA